MGKKGLTLTWDVLKLRSMSLNRWLYLINFNMGCIETCAVCRLKGLRED